MRIYTVDIVVEAANLKFMTKAYAARLAEFVLGVQQAEPTIITSVTTEVMDFGKVTEKAPIGDSVTVGIARVWTCTRAYRVTVHEVGDAPDAGAIPTTSQDVSILTSAVSELRESIRLLNLGLEEANKRIVLIQTAPVV